MLIARRGEGASLDRLAGLRAAWVDPLSAGGYLLAVGLLRARGVVSAPPGMDHSRQQNAPGHQGQGRSALTLASDT